MFPYFKLNTALTCHIISNAGRKSKLWHDIHHRITKKTLELIRECLKETKVQKLINPSTYLLADNVLRSGELCVILEKRVTSPENMVHFIYSETEDTFSYLYEFPYLKKFPVSGQNFCSPKENLYLVWSRG